MAQPSMVCATRMHAVQAAEPAFAIRRRDGGCWVGQTKRKLAKVVFRTIRASVRF